MGWQVNRSVARHRVLSLKNFKGSNIEGVMCDKFRQYVVYSYKVPIYAFCVDTGVWYGNDQYYSRTTQQHKRVLKPTEDEHIIWLEADDLINLVYFESE